MSMASLNRIVGLYVLTPAVVSLCLVGVSHAVVLADYQFAGGSNASTDTNADTSASVISTTGDVGISSTSSTMFIRSNQVTQSQPPNSSAADRAQFSITPTGGPLDYDLLTALVQADAGSNWEANWDVYSSTDGFSSNEVLHGTLTDVFGGGATQVQVDISSLSNISGAVSFRLVPHVNLIGGEPATSGKILRIRNFQVTGDLTPAPAVPEPMTASLAGLGFIAMLTRRRRGA